jgi:hypothetical protein
VEVEVKPEIHVRVPGGTDDGCVGVVSELASVRPLVSSNFERN